MRIEDLDETVAVWERARWESLPWLEERMGLLAVQPGLLDRLYVEPGLQRQGIGTALLDKARVLLPGGFELYAHQRNGRARAFYESRGLRAVTFGTSPAPESEPDVKYAWVPEA